MNVFIFSSLLRPEACNFIKKETLAQVFSCEFFLQNTSGRLLLKIFETNSSTAVKIQLQFLRIVTGKKTPSNKTLTLSKSMNMDIWVVGTLKQSLLCENLKPKQNFRKNKVVARKTLFPVISFLKRVCVLQKSCFKIKVLKTFRISSDCHIKTCHLSNGGLF